MTPLFFIETWYQGRFIWCGEFVHKNCTTDLKHSYHKCTVEFWGSLYVARIKQLQCQILTGVIPVKSVTWDNVRKSLQGQGLILIIFLFCRRMENTTLTSSLQKILFLIQDILPSIYFTRSSHAFQNLIYSWLAFPSSYLSIIRFSLPQPVRVLQQLLLHSFN